MAFFPLDQSRHGRSARMIANLVALDTAAVFAESRRLGVAGDGLAWFGDADAIAGPALAPLISTGAQAGLATVLSTVSAQAAGQLAALANVLVIRGPADTARLPSQLIRPAHGKLVWFLDRAAAARLTLAPDRLA